MDSKSEKPYIHSAGMIFEAEYEGSWLLNPVVKEMIADVDQSEVLDGELIKSPVLGLIPPTTLSGGVKTLIMAYYDDSRVYNLTSCGDNCAKWALKLAETKDITMRLGHYMNFEDCEPFSMHILNSGRDVVTFSEFLSEMNKAVRIHDMEAAKNEG